jgi:predicted subunit of tRNA(5-methylaminomethyl-2-thiouridylate) methyltransferase
MAEKENKIIEARREFRDPVSGKTYYIGAPTADDVRGADWQYSKIYTKSLVEGITTSAEMIDILMRRGVVGPEFEQRQKELTDILSVKVEALHNASTIDDKQQAANEVATTREELFNWNQRLNGPMSNTCEQMADDSRLEYLTSRMIQEADGTRVWEDYSDFLTEKNQSLAMRARFEVMLYLQGLASDFLEKTPEALAIREIEEEIQTKATEALAELEKAAAEKEKPESKKKPGPKKGSSNKKSSE